jgi:hypothetical protein
MPGLLRHALSRRLRLVLGFALVVLVWAPSASAATQLDTVTATSSGAGLAYTNINISAQSGTSGQDPSGTASFDVPSPYGGVVNLSGPVTCLSVTGPDRGGGTLAAPTTAILNFKIPASAVALPNVVVTVELVDNGGNGADIIAVDPGVPPPVPLPTVPRSACLPAPH